jgi:hypothetical protein
MTLSFLLKLVSTQTSKLKNNTTESIRNKLYFILNLRRVHSQSNFIILAVLLNLKWIYNLYNFQWTEIELDSYCNLTLYYSLHMLPLTQYSKLFIIWCYEYPLCSSSMQNKDDVVEFSNYCHPSPNISMLYVAIRAP